MKQKIALFFTALFVAVSLFPFSASAHPGRTDSNGGHYDHSTGEYHYHHGYPAHEHYDIDGDGIPDCPYNFVDKTGQSSGSSSGGKITSDTANGKTDENKISTSLPTSAPNNLNTQKEEVIKVPEWIYLILSMMVVFIIYLLISNKKKYDTITEFKDKIRKNESISLEIATKDDSLLLRNEVVNLTSKLSTSERKTELLQQMCAHAAKQIEKLIKEKDAISNELETLKATNSSQYPYSISLQRVCQMELEEADAENELLKKENASLLNKINELESGCNQRADEDNTPVRYCGTPFIKEIRNLEEKIKLLNSELDRKNEQISKLSEEIHKLSQVSQPGREEAIPKIPNGISFAKDGLPVYWKPNPKKPYGDFTVYLNEKSGIYHVDYFCAPYMSKETHIFKVIDRARPCKKCADGFFDFRDVPDWYIPK